MARFAHALQRAALTGGVLVALALAGCATVPASTTPFTARERPAAQAALPPVADGQLADIESAIRSAHGFEASGFALLDSNEEGLRWRLALIDSARQSLDIQYYVWFGDTVGTLVFKRVLDAADRGVKVRILIDDLNSMLRVMTTVELRDDLFALIDAHPNIQIRLFNPWKDRSLLGRVADSLAEMARINQRMHKKQMIVDNRAIVVGGCNLGDEYFGMNEGFNFRDLDVLGIGPVARQGSVVFDSYWNSLWVLPVASLRLPINSVDALRARRQMADTLQNNPKLARFALAPQDWSTELAALGRRLHVGASRMKADAPTDRGIRHDMAGAMYELAGTARREILIANAYIIPDERFVDALRRKKESGVTVRILTNSLASHDVPAVNSHYKQWRRPLREAVTALHETRHDAAVKETLAETPPTRAPFMGLHSKGMVIDRERLYVGSMNFDPRSADINTEMGVLIESRPLAEELARAFERDMTHDNAWQVEIGTSGQLTWSNGRETVTSQPARNFWQRVQDIIFMAFPRELY